MNATQQALEMTRIAAVAATDKKATNLVAFDVSDQIFITDVFLICSASTERQVHAVHDEIEEKLLDQGFKPLRREGQGENRWVLLDFGDIVVHIQHTEERAFYALERLWSDCPVVDVT